MHSSSASGLGLGRRCETSPWHLLGALAYRHLTEQSGSTLDWRNLRRLASHIGGGEDMAVTAGMVKELREKTGAGMMDCKKRSVRNRGRP